MLLPFPSIVCVFLLCVSLAHGAEVLTQFDADARMEVDNDEMLVVLSVSKDGPQASQITQEVLAKLTSAVERSKQHADIERKVGHISTSPVCPGRARKGRPARASASASQVLQL